MEKINKRIIISPENPNGIVVDMTAEEIAEKETYIVKSDAIEQAQETAETAKATAQASGNTKLLALGLTQAEATALTGYTPE